MVVLSIVSPKGGVGKTTLSANLSAGLSAARNVVAVDLDPQNALRLHLGVAASEIDGIARATLEQRDWKTCLFRGAGGAYVLPFGNINEVDRDEFEVHLSTHPDWLKTGLRSLGLGNKDLVVLDTPPGPSLYQQQALKASQIVLVAIQADAASYATLPSMEVILDRYCTGRPDFFGASYLLNSVNVGSTLSRDVARVVQTAHGDKVAPVIIHQDESVREALAFDQLVLQYAPHSEAANDLGQTVRWLNERLASVFRAQAASAP